jgi:hypothetical protein
MSLTAGLAPAVAGVWAALAFDPDVTVAAPGGVHVELAPQGGTYPVLIVEWVEGTSTAHFGGVVAVETTTVRVRAVDKTSTATAAQTLANAADRRLTATVALPMPTGWHAMQVTRVSGFETIRDEADDRYQERGASYRVLSCPI